MSTVVRFCTRVFGALAPAVARWRVEAHQFRIAASAETPGQPTPEGVHRDGVDFVEDSLYRAGPVGRSLDGHKAADHDSLLSKR